MSYFVAFFKENDVTHEHKILVYVKLSLTVYGLCPSLHVLEVLDCLCECIANTQTSGLSGRSSTDSSKEL